MPKYGCFTFQTPAPGATHLFCHRVKSPLVGPGSRHEMLAEAGMTAVRTLKQKPKLVNNFPRLCKRDLDNGTPSSLKCACSWAARHIGHEAGGIWKYPPERIRRTSHRKNFQADKSTRKFLVDLFIEYLVGGCEDKDLSDSAKQHTEG
jgi:hypothetical protein